MKGQEREPQFPSPSCHTALFQKVTLALSAQAYNGGRDQTTLDVFPPDFPGFKFIQFYHFPK